MRLLKYFAAASMLASVACSHAALIARDLDGDPSTVEAYWDSGRNLTWIADWKLAFGSVYDTWNNGGLTWRDANAWAAGLELGGFSDWRLPSANGADGSPAIGCACSDSEFGHLWYEELGNPIGGFNTTGPFQSIPIAEYWTGTESALDNRLAWSFRLRDGWSDTSYGKDGRLIAIAVRDGDVLNVRQLPEPNTILLVLLATLLSAIGSSRRQDGNTVPV